MTVAAIPHRLGVAARAFGGGFVQQLRAIALERRHQLLLALFLFMTVLVVDTYRQRMVRELPIAVVDLDGTAVTRTIQRALDATPELRVVTDGPATIDDARVALVRGTLAAMVILPDGFTAGVKRGRQADAVLAVDMSNIVPGKSAARAVQRVLSTVGAGAQVTALEKLGNPPDRALARAVPIALTESLAENPGSSYAVYLAPPFAYYLLNIVSLFLAWAVLWRPPPEERPIARAGRLAAVFAAAFVLGLLVTYGVLPRDGVIPASPFPLVALALAAFLFVNVLFASALAALYRGALIAFQTTVLLAMLSLMISGLTWPWDAIPAPIRAVAIALPFTAFGRAFRIFLHAPAGLADLGRPLALLGIQAAAFAVVIAASRLGWRAVAAARRAP